MGSASAAGPGRNRFSPLVRLRFLLVPLALTIASTGSSPAASFYVTSDVPISLGATDHLPRTIIRFDGGASSAVFTFPDILEVDALHRRDDGSWLFSVEAPVKLGLIDADPRDIVRYSPAPGYSFFMQGAAAGIPAGSNVDAVFLVDDDPNEVVLSFDIPTTIGPRTYLPADLALYESGAFSIYFDSQAVIPPIPLAANLIAAGSDGSSLIFSLDVPTTLGVTTYEPGDIVAWDGVSLSLYQALLGWSSNHLVSSLAFLPAPGQIPPTLSIEPAGTPGQFLLQWEASCSAGADDYAIYEGSLGGFYSHAAIDCADDGHDLQEIISPSAGDHYYLVVPLNPNGEGSYGQAFPLAERPAGSTLCVPVQAVRPCP